MVLSTALKVSNLARILTEGFDMSHKERLFKSLLRKVSQTLPHSRLVLCSFIGFLLLTSVGCLSNYSPQPPTSISATSHPLVAQYNVSYIYNGLSAWVEFGTDTNYGRQTSVVSSPSTDTNGRPSLSIMVAGMLPNTAYHMRAHMQWSGGEFVDKDHVFTTGALPTDLFAPQITMGSGTATPNAATSAPAGGVELLSLVPNFLKPAPSLQTLATDLDGKIIWYCPQGGIAPKLLPNGHFLLQLGNDLQEVDLACNVLRDVSSTQVVQSLQTQGYSMPAIQVFHHDAIALPNGHWITLAQIQKDFSNLTNYPGTTVTVTSDALVDIDPNGNVAWAWSAFDHLIPQDGGSDSNGLDINRNLQGWPDWTHSNAIVYTADGNLLLSMRHQSWVLKLDYENGKGSGNILWKLGQDGNFTLLGGDPTQWFYGQHNPYIVSNNGSTTTLAVYDDGNLRIDSTGTACGSSSTAPACYSRAAIFDVDEDHMVANLLWDYQPGYFSFWGGSISTLPNGNVEFGSSDPFGTANSIITEVTQTSSPQIVWQMNIAGEFAYRGDRIPSLYPGVSWSK